MELARAAARAGLDAIAFTDHDTFWPERELARVSAEAGILVLPGAEINTDTGHALVFGLDAYEFGMHRPEHLRRRVEEAGGAMVAAHPYRRALPFGIEPGTPQYDNALERACDGPLLQMVSAAEVVNGRGSDVQNRFASALLERTGVRAVAASDAHSVEGIGRYATEFERPVGSLRDLIRELRAGRFRPWTAQPV